MTKPKWVEHLPEWASYNPKDGAIEVKANVVYPLWLKKMEEADPSLKGISENITQEALEAARLTFTRFLKKIMYDHDGKGLYLRIIAGKEKRWVLAKYIIGDPVNRRIVYIKLGLDARLG